MAINEGQPLERLLGEIARRRRAHALARAGACCAALFAAGLIAAACGDLIWAFSAWDLWALDAVFVMGIAVSWKVLRRVWGLRFDAVATAAMAQQCLGLRHSELTNAVELRTNDGAAAGDLQKRAIACGDEAVRKVDADAISPRRSKPWLVAIAMTVAILSCLAATAPGPALAIVRRLACPWSDEPAYNGLAFAASWSQQRPRYVEAMAVSATGVSPSVADVVWVRRSWWGGVGEEVARTPLRRRDEGKFSGTLAGDPPVGRDGMAEYLIVTDRGRSRVFELGPVTEKTAGLTPVAVSAQEMERARMEAAAGLLIRAVAMLAEQWRQLQSSATPAKREAMHKAARSAAEGTDGIERWAHERRESQAWGDVEQAAHELAAALREEAQRAQSQSDAVATTQAADVGGDARMDALRQKAAALAAAIGRHFPGEKAEAADGSPASGSGDGPGDGSGGSRGDSSGPAYPVMAGESGRADASTTQATEVSVGGSSSLLDVPMKYRDIAAAYLQRLASDRAQAATQPR